MENREIVLRNLSAFRAICHETVQRAYAQGKGFSKELLYAIKWDDVGKKFYTAVLAPSADSDDYIAGFSSADWRYYRENGFNNAVEETVYAATIEY